MRRHKSMNRIYFAIRQWMWFSLYLLLGIIWCLYATANVTFTALLIGLVVLMFAVVTYLHNRIIDHGISLFPNEVVKYTARVCHIKNRYDRQSNWVRWLLSNTPLGILMRKY